MQKRSSSKEAGHCHQLPDPIPVSFWLANLGANILFAVAFDERHRKRGVRAAAVHPGGIQTELGRHIDPSRIEGIIDQMKKQLAAEGKAPFHWKTIPQGAATSVWAGVVAPADEIGGRYCENCHVGQTVADDVTISAISEGVRGYALDPKNAEALWKKSEELVGESFSRPNLGVVA